jgi:hypothetical protein
MCCEEEDVEARSLCGLEGAAWNSGSGLRRGGVGGEERGRREIHRERFTDRSDDVYRAACSMQKVELRDYEKEISDHWSDSPVRVTGIVREAPFIDSVVQPSGHSAVTHEHSREELGFKWCPLLSHFLCAAKEPLEHSLSLAAAEEGKLKRIPM